MSLASSVRRMTLGSVTLASAATLTAAAFVVAAQTTTPVQATKATPVAVTTGARLGVEQRNSAIIRRMYADVFGTGGAARVGDYFARDLVQHDPAIAGGLPGLITAVRQQQGQNPRPVITIKRLLAEGPLVVVHTHISATPANEFSGRASIELYRLAGDRVVEHWTVAEDVPATSVSGNSMFSDLYRYDGTPPPVSAAQEDANKQLVLKAWTAGFSAGDVSVVDRYWAPGNQYLQHNPLGPSGSAALKGFLASLPPSVSQSRFSVADGDLVFSFNQNVTTSQDLNSDTVGTAVADIYRVVNSKIVEHWDVLQPVPATSANGNSMFSSLYPSR